MEHQLCLSCKNHQATLVGVFENLLENGSLADCTVAAEGKYFKAHKLVLSAFSPYFAVSILYSWLNRSILKKLNYHPSQALLQEQYDKHPIFMLKDVSYTELRALMLYMYHGEVHIPQSQLNSFLKAAESLKIKGLQKENQQEDTQIERTPGKSKNVSRGDKHLSYRPQKLGRFTTNGEKTVGKMRQRFYTVYKMTSDVWRRGPAWNHYRETKRNRVA